MKGTPHNYVPYKNIKICSNELIDCGIFIDHNGFYPLLIGKGVIPQIWINNRLSINNPTFKPIVEQSVSNDTRIKIDINTTERTLTIRLLNYNGIYDDIILNIAYNESSAIVNLLDMRPLGYNIYGNSTGLKVGELNIQNNVFSNVKTMFMFGEK